MDLDKYECNNNVALNRSEQKFCNIDKIEFNSNLRVNP